MRSLMHSIILLGFCSLTAAAAEPERIRILFLGDNGHHQPAARFKQLQPVLAARGIDLVYSDKVEDLNPKTLADYRGLVIYANTTQISPEQEKSLLDFVEGGKGFIPLHCASYCFLNSPKYIDLVGAQFQKHGTGTFRTTVAAPENPVVQGFKGFESWDETYVHTKHNEKDRTVLEYRAEEKGREPWTWIRTQGKGRVFYTAWGHDERTWSNPGFQNLVERGIRWAVGDDPTAAGAFSSGPEMTAFAKDAKPFEYMPARVPFYPPGEKWGTQREPLKEMQKPLEPEESLKHYVHPVGFTLKLFACEPNFGGKPIAMSWDERGRLWTCVTTDYPNELQRGNRGHDKIVVCEDTSADGVADKYTVFADQLSIPTSVLPYRGGALVQNGTETLFLKDTNNDGVADIRKTVITGWALNDTHGGVSNFRLGLDGWVWAMQGYNDSSPVLTDGKKVTPFRQGFFRFKVEGDGEKLAVTELEYLRSTNNNTWGLGFSEEGVVFGSTANGNPSEYMPIPNRYYEAVRGWSSSVLNGIAESNKFYPVTDKVRQVDHHGGFTAAAGHALYTARNYPPEYWNRTAFVCEPTGHLCATFVIDARGAGFRSKNSWNLVASNDEWSAPIMAEVGPDGNVWILDWYNYIVQHNPTPAGFKTGKGNAYEIELRDKKHGRVYRLVPDKVHEVAAKEAPLTTLAGASPEQLVAVLKHSNMFWRLQAERLLIERGKNDVVPALIALVKDPAVDSVGLNVGAIHALLTLKNLGALDGKSPPALAAVEGALAHESAGVRRNAVQVLPNSDISALTKSGVLNDSAPQVQLAALLALAEMPPNESAGIALTDAFCNSTLRQDHWLLDAATATAARHASFFLTSLAKKSVTLESAAKLNRNLSPPNDAALERVAIVAAHYARSTPADIGQVLVAVVRAEEGVEEAILTGLERGWPKTTPAPLTPQEEEAIVAALPRLTTEARAKLILLGTRWGNERLTRFSREIAAAFLATAQDAKEKDKTRASAAQQYVDFNKQNPAAAGELLKLLGPRTSPELGTGFVEAVSHSEAAETGAALVASLGTASPAVRPAVLRALISRSSWTPALLDAIEKGQVQLVEIALDQQQALLTHPNKKLAERAKAVLAKGGALVDANRQKVIDELLPLTEKTGNASAGKEVFKKNCAKCHMHSGEGTKIGPDLTGMNVHPKHELIIHILDPSRSVEGNFRVYTVVTDEGKVINGLLASESKTALELFDAEGKKQVVQRDEVEQLVASPKSLMPEGFEKLLKPEEITDLMEFLTQRGKYVPIPLDKVATVVTTKGMFNSEEAEVERLIFADWQPKTFHDVPFLLVDPAGEKKLNAIMLYGENGNIPPKMPKNVKLPCNGPAKALHFLSGVSGWGWPAVQQKSVSMTVRLHYADGKTEDHPLKNGEYFADYIRRVDVPKSEFAFALRGQQLRYFAVRPERSAAIKDIELVKGNDPTSPVVMALTIETP